MRTVGMLFAAAMFLLFGFFAGACDTGDSIEGGCETHDDCNTPGAPERWCQPETGICLSFTSPPGETEDATPTD